MTSEINKYISQCEMCYKFEKKQQTEPLMSHKITECPWEKVEAELYTIYNKDNLRVVDYFSGLWEIDPIPQSPTAGVVIKKLKCHFARQGIPDTVISDNGLEFSAKEFQTFARDWRFDHQPGSAGHQQSN